MTYEEFLMEENYLEHHGIKGQKWGVRRTPEQLGHYIERKQKSLAKSVNAAKAAKASGNIKKLNKHNEQTKKIMADIKKAKAQKAKLEEEQKDRVDSENEEKRQKVLKEGSAADIYKHRHEFTPDELNNAIRRINTEQTLAAMKDIEKQTKLERGKKAFDTIVNTAESGIKLANKYDDVARTVNKFMGEGTLWSPTEQAEKKKKEHQREIENIMNSGSYETIMQNRNRLSPQQLRDAFQIAQTERTAANTLRINSNNALTTLRGEQSVAQTTRNNLVARENRANQLVNDIREQEDAANRRRNDRSLSENDRDIAGAQAAIFERQRRQAESVRDNIRTEREAADSNLERLNNNIAQGTEALRRSEERIFRN